MGGDSSFAATVAGITFDVYDESHSRVGLVGRDVGVHGGGIALPLAVSIQAPGAVGAPSTKRSSASIRRSVGWPQLHMSWLSPMRGGRCETAHGEPAGRFLGAERSLVGTSAGPERGRCRSLGRSTAYTGVVAPFDPSAGGDGGRELGRERKPWRVGDGSRLAVRDEARDETCERIVCADSELVSEWMSLFHSG